jgi:hypothetical protein
LAVLAGRAALQAVVAAQTQQTQSTEAKSATESRTLRRTLSWYHARPVRAAMARSRVVAALCVASACASAPRGPLAGASDAWSNAPEPSAPAIATSSVWERYADAQHWPAANHAPFAARGHQPEQLVDVRANDIARSAYETLVTDTVFPDGAELAELPHSQLGTGDGFAMHKNAGTWRYFQLDGSGRVLASGALALCEGCHAQAPADHVFGLPRAP